jgi:hypothetical protein
MAHEVVALIAQFFAAQVDPLLAALAGAGSVALELLLASFAMYVVVEWCRRRTLLIALRMSRSTVAEFALRDDGGQASADRRCSLEHFAAA